MGGRQTRGLYISISLANKQNNEVGATDGTKTYLLGRPCGRAEVFRSCDLVAESLDRLSDGRAVRLVS